MEAFTARLGESFLFVLAALTSWRVTALLAYERGPFALVEMVRRSMVRHRLGRLVGCFHCLGLWVAAVVSLVVYGVRPVTLFFWLAMAGVVSIIERWLLGAGMIGDLDGS